MRFLIFCLLIPFYSFSQEDVKLTIQSDELPYVKITELGNNIKNVPQSWKDIEYLTVKKTEEKIVYYANEEVIGEMKDKELILFLENNTQIKIDDKTCIIDGIPCERKFKIIKYDFALDFITMSYCCVSELPYLQYHVSGKTGLIDYRSGKIVTDTSNIEISSFRNGLADFKKNKLHGFINQNFEIVIPPVFTSVVNFNDNGLARASNEKFSGFIDQKGNWVHKFDKSVMTYNWPFFEGYASVKGSNKKFGFINKRGKLKIDMIYDMVSTFENGYAVARKGMVYGLLKKKKWIPLPEFNSIKHGNQGLFLAKKDKKWGIIDNKNKIIVPFIYDDLIAGSSFIYYKEENKWGIMSNDFKKIIAPQYDSIWGYGYGLFAVKINGKWGYINIKNEVIIPFIFESATPFTPYGRSAVEVNGKYELIDNQGNFLSTRGWLEFQKSTDKKKIGDLMKPLGQ
ncbi:MAG TPA: WG repeat-containing protein [Flavobacterium lutivivi]|nr:WG repeat-containing protein [Flavobacterium lutivivi]